MMRSQKLWVPIRAFSTALGVMLAFFLVANVPRAEALTTGSIKITSATNYLVTITGSYATTSGAGAYDFGQIVTIDAGTRSGYTFDGWSQIATDLALANQASQVTTFSMPATDVVLTASWKALSSTTDSDDSTKTPDSPAKPKPDPSDEADLEGLEITEFISPLARTLTIQKGKSLKVPFIAYADTKVSGKVNWKNSKPAVAQVSKNKKSGSIKLTSGKVAYLTISAKKTGASTVSCQIGEHKLSFKVKVVSAAKKVARLTIRGPKHTFVKKATIAIKKGQTARLSALYDTKATLSGKAIAWKSSKKGIATIDAAGHIKAKKKGKTKITLTLGGRSLTITLKVK